MSETWILMLRSINVGAHNRIAMAALTETIEGLGCSDVETYVQSGNVILASALDPGRLATDVEAALSTRHDIDTVAILRRPDELARSLDVHPFRDDVDDDDRATVLHVGFCAAAPDGRLSEEDRLRVDPDRAAVVGREVYLHYPNGMARTKLNGAFLERRLGVSMTARNWRTISELVTRST